MPFEGDRVHLNKQQRSELQEIARSAALPAGFVLRAKILLLLADGLSYVAIKDKLDTTAPTIARWKKRFLEQGLDGFETHRPGQGASKLTSKLRARILSATRRKPRDGSTHWSCRKLATELGISKTMVHKVWQEAGLKPHRLERYMASNDPDFERKAADIIGLYLDPPQYAAVFSVDEKTAIQALDRRDQVAIDGRVLAFAVGLSVFTAVLFGLAPAMQSARRPLRAVLQNATSVAATSFRETRFRDALVVGEIALCLVLLVGAGLLIGTFWRTRPVDVGFNPQNRVVANCRCSGRSMQTNRIGSGRICAKLWTACGPSHQSRMWPG